MKLSFIPKAAYLLPGLFILHLACFQAYAQITMTINDFPQVGMLVVKDVDSTTTISPGNAGLNQVWDYSNLVPSYTDSVLYMMPYGLPGSEKFPDANIAEKDANAGANYDGSFCYTYYKSTPGGWLVMGQEYKISFWGFSFLIHLGYSPFPVILSCPFTYNSTNSQDFILNSYSAGWYNGIQTDSSLVVSHVTVNQVADASGTILTPNGSFEALRVKEHVINTDSVFKYSITGWTFEETSDYEYDNFRWFANGIGEVCAITVDGKKSSNGFSYFKSSTIVGEPEPVLKGTARVFPNPVKDYLSIEMPEKIDRIEIIDLAGKKEIFEDCGSRINLSHLSSGMYTLKIVTQNGITSQKIIKN